MASDGSAHLTARGYACDDLADALRAVPDVPLGKSAHAETKTLAKRTSAGARSYISKDHYSDVFPFMM